MSGEKLLIHFTCVVLLITSCENTDDIDSFLTKDPMSFNTVIQTAAANGESWAADPMLIVNRLFRPEEFERKILVDYTGHSTEHVTIVYTREGLSDDSVNGEKQIIEFKRENNVWKIITLRIGFKCWESRGHTNYSGALCG